MATIDVLIRSKMDSTFGSHAAAANTGLGEALPPVASSTGLTLESSISLTGNARFGFVLVALTALGALGLSSAIAGLWTVWTNDPLRSIGMLIVPASIVLTLRVWKQMGWELDGTWWGLVPLAVAFVFADSGLKLAWFVIAGQAKMSLLPPRLSIYFFASGIILLFAGFRVWRRAWFPLALLLLAQPVPAFANHYLDLPLQDLSAQFARSFARWIGFHTTNREMLRLMFSPSFGMFIAPGCDGLRGAVTLAYVALIAGYLKRLRFLRWAAYIGGAILMGYLFNVLRLCALVVYYRIALGHTQLERAASQADYVIGGGLMFVAAVLFVWMVMRKDGSASPVRKLSISTYPTMSVVRRNLRWRIAVFAVVAITFAVPGLFALMDYQKSFAAAVRDGDLTADQLDNLMPRQFGGYRLNRAWQEVSNGRVALETAAYQATGSGEVIVGVWLPPGRHSMHESWRTHGEDPEKHTNTNFLTAGGRAVSFETAFYSDGVTDSFAGNALCTPAACLAQDEEQGMHMLWTTHPIDFNTRGSRAIPIFFRVEMPHAGVPAEVAYNELKAEAQHFLTGVDFPEISKIFQ